MKNIVISFTVVVLLVVAFVSYESIRSQGMIQQAVDPKSAVELGRLDAEESYVGRNIHLHQVTSELGSIDYPGVSNDERAWFFEQFPINRRGGFCGYSNDESGMSLSLERYKNSVHYALAFNIRMMELLYEERVGVVN